MTKKFFVGRQNRSVAGLREHFDNAVAAEKFESRTKWGFLEVPLYKKDFLSTYRAILALFGIGKDKIDSTYTKNNIKEEFEVDKKTFAAHVLEFLSNRAKWEVYSLQSLNPAVPAVKIKLVRKQEQ